MIDFKEKAKHFLYDFRASGDTYATEAEELARMEKELRELVEQGHQTEGAALLLATEKGLTPLGRLIDACHALLKDTHYVLGMSDDDPHKGAGNRIADAMEELFPRLDVNARSSE